MSILKTNFAAALFCPFPPVSWGDQLEKELPTEHKTKKRKKCLFNMYSETVLPLRTLSIVLYIVHPLFASFAS